MNFLMNLALSAESSPRKPRFDELLDELKKQIETTASDSLTMKSVETKCHKLVELSFTTTS